MAEHVEHPHQSVALDELVALFERQHPVSLTFELQPEQVVRRGLRDVEIEGIAFHVAGESYGNLRGDLALDLRSTRVRGWRRLVASRSARTPVKLRRILNREHAAHGR